MAVTWKILDCLHKAPLSREVKASETGFITHMDTEGIGVASVMLGAGRSKKEDTIDYSAGILLEKKYGDCVRAGRDHGSPLRLS